MKKAMNSELVLAKILAAQIREKRLSVKELSAACGVSGSTLHEWLGGRAPRNPLQVKKVADYLGVSLHFLLFGSRDAHERMSIVEVLQEDMFQGCFEITLKRVKIKKEDPR